MSSSYPIVLTRLGGPRSRPYTSRKICRVWSGIEPGTSWMAVRRANHYTKQVVYLPEGRYEDLKNRWMDGVLQCLNEGGMRVYAESLHFFMGNDVPHILGSTLMKITGLPSPMKHQGMD